MPSPRRARRPSYGEAIMGYATEIPEAFGEAEAESTASVVRDLRAVVPAQAEADVGELERVAARHRVLLIRTGAVIAVSTVISVTGALFFHAVLGGIIIIGVWFPNWVGLAKGAQVLARPADMGGSPGGFTMLGLGPDDNAPPAERAPVMPGVPVRGPAEALPQLPEASSAQMAAAPFMRAEPLFSTTSDLGTALVNPPPERLPSVPGVRVAAPGATPTAESAVSGVPGMPARGTGMGNGGGDEDRIIDPFSKRGDGSGGTGSGGIGRGIGSGRGNGIDRGMSAADRPAQLLNQSSNAPSLTLPMKYQMRPPEKDVMLCIALAADGTITSVKVEQSCGYAEVDEIVREHVLATYRFSPEYQGGKAVDSVQHWGYVFHPL